MTEIHKSAAEGFAAGAALYVQGRPDYPSEVIDWLKTDLGLASGKVAVDLGAGTGKFTPYLKATGASVIAVEPVQAMLDEFIAHHPDVEARQGVATHLPLPDASVDAVVCAQSFHWFAKQPAVDEIDRVLKPQGALGLVWNVRDESVGWVAALTKILLQFEGETPHYRSQEWRNLFASEAFGPLQERRFPHGHTGTPETVIVNRILSTSYIAALGENARAEVAAQVRALIAATPELAGKQTVTFPYETVAFISRKTL